MWHLSDTKTWIPLYLFLIFKIFKKFQRKTVWYVLGTIIVSVALSNFISSELLKHTVCRLRPSHVPELQKYIHIVKGYTGGQYGFASSHAANTAAIACTVSYFFQKKWIYINSGIWALAIAYSRIYLGVHYPGDVVAGIVIGICISSLCIYLFTVLIKHRV
jgi:undecaprenyl-diphosphatase